LNRVRRDERRHDVDREPLAVVVVPLLADRILLIEPVEEVDEEDQLHAEVETRRPIRKLSGRIEQPVGDEPELDRDLITPKSGRSVILLGHLRLMVKSGIGPLL
jgi:hypothetical protein